MGSEHCDCTGDLLGHDISMEESTIIELRIVLHTQHLPEEITELLVDHSATPLIAPRYYLVF